MTLILYRISFKRFAMAAPAPASAPASDFEFVSNPSPMSDGSDSPLLVRRVSGSSQNDVDQQPSSSGLTEIFQAAAVGGSETVITVSATEPVVRAKTIISMLDGSGSMKDIFRDTLAALGQQVHDAHELCTPVIVLFFRDNSVRRVDYPPGTPFNPEDYQCGGQTPLFDALAMAFNIAKELPDYDVAMFCRTDGCDTSSGISKCTVRNLYQEFRGGFPNAALFIVSSASDALELAKFLEMKREHILVLTGEDKRDAALDAARRVLYDFQTSSSVGDVCFSEQDRFSSEGPSHHWQSHPWPSHGPSASDYVGCDDYTDDCVPTPKGPNVSHSNGSGGGACDQVWSASDRY